MVFDKMRQEEERLFRSKLHNKKRNKFVSNFSGSYDLKTVKGRTKWIKYLEDEANECDYPKRKAKLIKRYEQALRDYGEMLV